MSPVTRITLSIKGTVQGVGYREWTRRTATDLKLTGSVKNEADGSVSAIIEGPADVIHSMIERCKRGPALARVTTIDQQTREPTGEFADFRIIR